MALKTSKRDNVEYVVKVQYQEIVDTEEAAKFNKTSFQYMNDSSTTKTVVGNKILARKVFQILNPFERPGQQKEGKEEVR